MILINLKTILTWCEGSEVFILITVRHLEVRVRVHPEFSPPERFSFNFPDEVSEARPDIAGSGEDAVPW